MTAPSTRDLRIDFLRGLALLIIFIDHVPANVLSRITPQNFGFSNAADTFVLLAGVSAGLAYGATTLSIRVILRRLLRRIAQLYLAQLALLWTSIGVLAAAIIVFEKDAFMGHELPVLVQVDLWSAVWDSMMLFLQPTYLDILPLYVALLLTLPLFLLLERVQPGAALVFSVAVWFLADATRLNLPGSRSLDGWYFNPFTWQLLFCIGLLGARTIRHPSYPTKSRWFIALASAYVMIAFIVVMPCRLRIITNFCVLYAPESDLANLPPWRVAHGVALLYLALKVIPDRAAWLSRYPARVVVALGRNSLPVFCTGALVGLVGAILLSQAGAGWQMQLLLNAAGIAVLYVAAWCSERAASVDLRHAPPLFPSVVREGVALLLAGLGLALYALAGSAAVAYVIAAGLSLDLGAISH